MKPSREPEASFSALVTSTAFRQITHDLRGLLAAALANVEFVREQELSREGAEAAMETVHELRIAADVIALLGALDVGGLAQIDLRAVLWLEQRAGAPLRLDPTGPSIDVGGDVALMRAFASAVASLAEPGAPLPIRSDEEGIVLDALDARRSAALRDRLRADGIPAEVKQRADGTLSIRWNGARAS